MLAKISDLFSGLSKRLLLYCFIHPAVISMSCPYKSCPSLLPYFGWFSAISTIYSSIHDAYLCKLSCLSTNFIMHMKFLLMLYEGSISGRAYQTWFAATKTQSFFKSLFHIPVINYNAWCHKLKSGPNYKFSQYYWRIKEEMALIHRWIKINNVDCSPQRIQVRNNGKGVTLIPHAPKKVVSCHCHNLLNLAWRFKEGQLTSLIIIQD